ncbi:MAG: WYL domain-containing protein [Phycisphaerales bacterium]|nr:MAG: WYL domain-containing protein [Phycisphaerales bacterium]
MKHSRINRLMQILTTLQAGESYTIQELSRVFGTSRRTVFRDLRELQAIGVPCQYDAKTGRYTIDPEYFLPPADLNLREALGLLLLAHTVSEQMQMPFKKSALLAALKIENNLPEKVRQYCSVALRNISAGPHGQEAIRQNARFDRIFAQLYDAIARKRRVEIRYDSLFVDGLINVELCPYHLLYKNGAWHVLGLSSPHKSVRTFELDRVKELKATQRCFLDDEHFDVSEYLGRAWSVTPEGQIYDVRLRFLPRVARSVAEVKWHSTQKVTFAEDGSAIVEFRVDGLNEITWWVVSYGDQVQVLAPKALRARVLDVARHMVALNRNA